MVLSHARHPLISDNRLDYGVSPLKWYFRFIAIYVIFNLLEYKEKEVEVWNHVENMHGLLQFLA